MSIASGPHFEIPANVLAEWIELQGRDRWWTIDGDTFLTSRVAFPCRGDELAGVLRRANRPLLVTARDPQAHGQVVGRDQLDEVADKLGNNVFRIDPKAPKPSWADDLCLWLSWKDGGEEWMLAQDSLATAAFKDVRTTPVGNP